ncbi:MAG: aminotransferase class V-fold PLP-dependent enzyme [Gemmatimonadales bacterium]|nr:aminotransferase class V-fold PLP-dependent enzyme [Gemmatimonadales bacterium]MDZ4390335.1 aminotransferase class V-fold PLP-dependent enzyme [Gemmatimonadales bacterium]
MHAPPHPLAHWRDEFPIFRKTVYLNSCSLGALSRHSRDRAIGYLDQWEDRGAANWYDVWWAALEELRSRYGRLVSARPGEIALHASVSSILGVIASAIDTKRRPRIVTTRLDFPTVPYQWLPRDVEVVLLESPDGVTVPVEAFERAVDERTALVATSHVYFTSGAIQDVAAIGAIARRHGAVSLIDGYQGVGQLPVNAPELGIDCYCSGGLKWLLGGTGVCFLWANAESMHHLLPTSTGWFAHRDQFAFDPTTFVPHDDARRFEMGTPPLLPVYTQLGGLDVLEAVGAEAIRSVTMALTEDLIAVARERGLVPKVAASATDRSAIVMLPSDDPKAAVARLAERGFIVDARPGHVRVSPYFYNVADDHRAFLEAFTND